MPSLFEKKPVFSASIVVSFFFVAFALSVAGSIDFSHREGGSAIVSWSSRAGSGISVPACGSSSNLAPTCVGSSPSVTINWSWIVNVAHPRECNLVNIGIYKGGIQVQGYGGRACNDSVTWTGGESGTAYTYNVYFLDIDGNPAIETASGSFTTPNCAAGGGSAPVAEAGISKDGSLFRTSISVPRGVLTQIWFSADKDVTGDGRASRDPDGWNDPTDGVSSGGKCEWNVDLAAPGFSVQRTIANPPAAAACNVGPFSKIFNDPPGLYEYDIFRIIDQAGNTSNIASVFVNVVSSVAASLVANPPRINPGQTSMLSWNTEGFGPGDCSIDQGIGSVASDGSRIVSPIMTTRYTLSCDDGTNRVQTQAVVTVSGLPNIREIPPR